MISHERVREPGRFLHPQPVRRYQDLSWYFPTLRHAVYQYFREASRFREGRARTVLMPDYVPEGIYDPFRRLGFDVSFYRVGLDLACDWKTIRERFGQSPPGVFVYVHHFGVRHAENLRLLDQSLPDSTVLFEDFAHTVPHASLEARGHLCGFAFTKTIGVAEGSLLWFRDRSLLRPSVYSDEDDAARDLRARLRARLATETLAARCCPHWTMCSALRKLVGARRDYYPLLMASYATSFPRVERASTDVLDRADFDAVFARRRAHAERYLRGLDARLRLELPDEAFLQQSLLAFPIRVGDQLAVHRRLYRSGIEGYALIDRWWFAGGEPSELHRRHYLLPLHHRLSDHAIDTVIEAVNRLA